MKGIHPQTTTTIDQIATIVGLKLGSNLLQEVEMVEVQERILLLLQRRKSNQKTTKKRKWWIS